MFWNLVRYEFKNVNKWYLALYAAVLVLSILIGMQGHYYNYISFKDSKPFLFYLSSSRLWRLDNYTCDFNSFLDY